MRDGQTSSGHHRADCGQSRVRQFLGGSPTGLAESSSQYSYGLAIRLRLLSTLSRDNAVTTFDYRLVTIAWTGLAPINSNAFTGALGSIGPMEPESPNRFTITTPRQVPVGRRHLQGNSNGYWPRLVPSG